jgi:nicotinamide-nucleotide amidase
MKKLLLLALAAATLAAMAADKPPSAPALDYALVVTGEELLRGAFADAHTAFITRTLHLLGGHCVSSTIVDDKPADITDALQFATKKTRLVIVTGGLGPTVNDVTRGALADFTGIRLAENTNALADIERRVQTPRAQLRANLRRQALVPTRGGYLKNSQGTAPGLVFEPDGAVIVALPGPPRELQPMLTNELVPYLKRKFNVHPPGSTLTLRFVGVGQSVIDQKLRESGPLPADVTIGSSFEGSRVDFVFALPGDTAADRERLQQIETRLRDKLATNLYSTGASLEETVIQQLRARAGSLAIAEIATGGRLAASFNGVEGVGALLQSATVAPGVEQLRRLLDLPDRARCRPRDRAGRRHFEKDRRAIWHRHW